MHPFSCSCRCPCGVSIEWDAAWEMIGAGNDTEAIHICEKDCEYDVILGYADYMHVRFLLVPSLGVGIEVENYTDQNDIEYQLSESCRLNRKTAVTISAALSDYLKPPFYKKYRKEIMS